MGHGLTMNKDLDEALRVSATLNAHTLSPDCVSNAPCTRCRKIAAALLEAQADGVSQGRLGVDHCIRQERFLRAESQNLKAPARDAG